MTTATLSPFLQASADLAREIGVVPWEPGRAGIVFVPSDSEPGTNRAVGVDLDGRAAFCDCPARRTCKHMKLVEKEIQTVTQDTAMSTELVPIKLAPPSSLLPTHAELKTINDLALVAASSVGITVPRELNSPQKIATVMLYGRELGIKPMTSLSQIYLIEGRPQPSAQVMAGILATREPQSRITILESDENHAKLRIERPHRGIDATYETTIKDAERAGLVKPSSGWIKYPRERNIYHCMKRILRLYAPEIIHAIESADIFDDVQQAYNERQIAPARPGAAFFNEGDDYDDDVLGIIEGAIVEPEPEPEPEQETLPILEPPLTDEHREQIALWRGRISGEHGQVAMMKVSDWAKEQFPNAVVNGTLKASMLTGPQAELLITAMESVANKGPGALDPPTAAQEPQDDTEEGEDVVPEEITL